MKLLQIENRHGKISFNDGVHKDSADKLIQELDQLFGNSAVLAQMSIGDVVCAADDALEGVEVEINSPGGSVFEGHRIYNNTLFHCQDIGSRTYHVWPAKAPHVKAEWPNKSYWYDQGNNLFLGTAPATQLEDWTNNKFNLQAGAAAIDAGKQVSGITQGFLGKAPELGAYEVGEIRWIPGKNGRAKQAPQGNSLKAGPQQ